MLVMTGAYFPVALGGGFGAFAGWFFAAAFAAGRLAAG